MDTLERSPDCTRCFTIISKDTEIGSRAGSAPRVTLQRDLLGTFCMEEGGRL